MSGICDSCGRAVTKLNTCPVCGAKVCADCLLENGCKLCRGRIQID